jgi:glutathione synthase/RimK-type ligase-like ATP-grasp enzyme
MIILIGRGNDPHNQAIGRELKKLNAEYTLLDILTFQDSIKLKYFRGNTECSIVVDNRLIECNNITSVWNYSPLKIRIDKGIVRKSRDFINAEWSEGLASMWNSIDCKWVNSPNAIRNSVNRIKQLDLAHEVGLNTPDSLITNDPAAVIEFYRQYESNIIVKTLAGSTGLQEGEFIFTNKIRDEDLANISTLKYAPCLFQEYIAKKTELRITIIEETFFAAQIQSQLSNKTKHDWRNYDDFSKTPYQETTLPSDISNKLARLMKLMKLNFACVDLIVTPNNQIYFLEINPNGRWMWIEELTHMHITNTLARYLKFDSS